MGTLITGHLILQDADGSWALWATEGRDFLLRGVPSEGIVVFMGDLFGQEAADQARTEISYVMAMSEEERAAR